MKRARHAVIAAVVIAEAITMRPSSAQSQSPQTQAPAPPVTAVTDTGFPRQIVSGQTTIQVYQPQIDEWTGVVLRGRVAVSAQDSPSSMPAFGIVEFSARTDVDKDRRLVTVDQFKVTRASFPKTAKQAQSWTKLIEARAARLVPIGLDRLEAAVSVSSALKQSESMPLRNDPPAILVSTVPAMLVLIDGNPEFRALPATSVERVLNTRPLLLRQKGGPFYLKIFDGWLSAPATTGPWTVAASVPKDCETALAAAIAAKNADLLVGGSPDDAASQPSLKKGPVPHIYVETTPSELLVLDGAAKYVPIEGTQLIYAENTTGHLFVETAAQRAFVLASGRWFSGPSSLMGPWQFVPGDKLPADFKNIPDTSAKENVKASVPGTEQANEALVANSIPQTAKVQRKSARFSPTYDGEPKLEPIADTELRYVVNSSLPIIAVGSNADYYAVQNGVWFVSNTAKGPWVVAAAVPAVIYSIPPSSPLHYVTYVRVYDATTDYVVVGYTPGYYGAYVSNGCVVYGTGYVYTPWVGTYWYGPPVTYGFGVAMAYTPWTGWHVAYGFGWAWGATTVAIGWGWGPYPWWGPAGWAWGAAYPWVYRPGYGAAWGPRGAVAWGPGYWAGTTGNVYSRWGNTAAVTRRSGGFDAWTGNRWAGESGMAYNSRTGTLAAGQRAGVANAYTGNYAAGQRGTIVDPRTGTSISGGKVTAGNAVTGRDVTAGRATIEGPGGREATIGGVVGDRGGVIRTDNNVYAGHDGSVYRHQDGGGWEKHTDGGWEPTNLGQGHELDRDRTTRATGESRWSGYRNGGFRTAGARRPAGGGRRR